MIRPIPSRPVIAAASFLAACGFYLSVPAAPVAVAGDCGASAGALCYRSEYCVGSSDGEECTTSFGYYDVRAALR